MVNPNIPRLTYISRMLNRYSSVIRDMMEAKYDTPARLKELVTCAAARAWLLYAIDAIDKAAELLKELEEDI